MPQRGRKRTLYEEGRKFNPKWGVHYFVVQSGTKVLCLICHKTLGIFNVQRHYNTKHEVAFSQFTGEERIKKFKLMRQSALAKENEAVHMAVYKVAYALAKEGKPFTHGKIIQRILLEMGGKLCREKMPLFKQVNLAPHIIADGIEDMGPNILEQIAEKARHFEQYSIALDELVAFDVVQLLIFVRGIDSDFNVTQGLASMQRMQGPVTGETLFQYLEMTLSNYHLEWEKLKCVTIGGNNISGAKEALVEQVAQAAASGGFPKPMFLHCVIHQLAQCGTHVDILSVLKPVLSMVNYIRAHGRNHHPFHEFLKEIDSEFADLRAKTFAERADIYDYVAVQWLNFGEVLSQFFQLREEIKSFLPEDVQQKQLLSKTDWLWKLAFVVDLMGHMNRLCLNLQGGANFVTNVFSHVTAFRAELIQFEGELLQQNLDNFPCAARFHGESQAEFPSSFVTGIIAELQKKCNELFPDFDRKADEMKMLQDPFHCGDLFPSLYKFEIIDLRGRYMLDLDHGENELFEFYKSLQSKEFPKLKQLALGYLSIFGRMSLFEETFSKKYLQSQNRGNLSEGLLKSMLTIGSSCLQPQFREILQRKLQLPSGSA